MPTTSTSDPTGIINIAAQAPAGAKVYTDANGVNVQDYSGVATTAPGSTMSSQDIAAGIKTAGYGTTAYGGQQVLTGDKEMQTLNDGVASHNQLTGQNLTAYQYDKMINPSTYGARWSADGTPLASGSTSTPASPPAPTPPPAGGASGSSGSGSGYTPWNVTPEQTVQDRIASIMNPNNPLIQQARAQENDQMNSRGLVNSAMAGTAADAAAYQAAVPIATADAATFSKAGEYNSDIQNQMAMQGRQLSTQQGIANLQAQTQRYGYDTSAATQKYGYDTNAQTTLTKTGMDNSTALAQTTLSTDAQKSIASMSTATQVQLNDALNTNRVLLQNSQAAANLANQYALNVGNIDANTTMDAAAKRAAIQNQTQMFNNSIKALKAASPGIPDVSGDLTFDDTAGGSSATDTGAPVDSGSNPVVSQTQ